MSKEQESFNFNLVNKFNVDDIKSIAKNFSNEWLGDTSRQDTFAVHKHTMSYFLYKTDISWKRGQEYAVNVESDHLNLLDIVEPIITDLEKNINGTRGNVLLIKLLANSEIGIHKDSGEYLMSSRRYHIPIITSENTYFGVGDEVISMQEGECWEINNAKLHYVKNKSDFDRIHLVVDIMPRTEIE